MHSCWDLLANQPTACVSHLHPSIFVSSGTNDNLLAGLCLNVFRNVFLRYDLAVFHFVVMSQHHCGIEMSIFGGGGKRHNCKI